MECRHAIWSSTLHVVSSIQQKLADRSLAVGHSSVEWRVAQRTSRLHLVSSIQQKLTRLPRTALCSVVEWSHVLQSQTLHVVSSIQEKLADPLRPSHVGSSVKHGVDHQHSPLLKSLFPDHVCGGANQPRFSRNSPTSSMQASTTHQGGKATANAIENKRTSPTGIKAHQKQYWITTNGGRKSTKQTLKKKTREGVSSTGGGRSRGKRQGGQRNQHGQSHTPKLTDSPPVQKQRKDKADSPFIPSAQEMLERRSAAKHPKFRPRHRVKPLRDWFAGLCVDAGMTPEDD